MDTDGTDFLQQTIGDREDARFFFPFLLLVFHCDGATAS